MLTRLNPSFHEKVWGSHNLSPWFPDSEGKTGEVSFLPEGPPLPLLVKFIFTTERLSVQVHPGGSGGKTELWHVLRAAPGATVACGLRERISPERLREASLSGEIERLLTWTPVKPGDTIFVPAGTIHAIGAGLAICEIQQNSDVTYRLYDYGRPRDLHLEQAMTVAQPRPHPGVSAPVRISEAVRRLAECEHFVTYELDVQRETRYVPEANRFDLLIALEGSGRLDGAPYRAGEVWHVAQGTAPFVICPETPSRFLRTHLP